MQSQSEETALEAVPARQIAQRRTDPSPIALLSGSEFEHRLELAILERAEDAHPHRGLPSRERHELYPPHR